MSRVRAAARALFRAPISPAAFRAIALGALVALGIIVVSGAAVRLTGSGMGCPTWPACEDGSLTPRGATGHHGWIEFLNRVFTGLVSVAVIAAVLGARRRVPYRADLVRLAWGLVAGVAAQALLGGLVVVLHVAPLAVAGHYLLSAVLIANAVVLHHRAGLADAPDPGRASAAGGAGGLRTWSRALVGLAGVVLVTGTLVTGSGPHGGDEAADRLPFAVVTVARVHSVAVWVFLAVTLVLLRRLVRGGVASAEAAGRAELLTVAVVAQGALGYAQYFTGVPEALVAGHVAGSVLVWVAVLRVHLCIAEPVEDTAATGPASTARAAVVGT